MVFVRSRRRDGFDIGVCTLLLFLSSTLSSLITLSEASTINGDSDGDASNLTLLFNTKYGKIFQVQLDRRGNSASDPTGVTSTTVPTSLCHEGSNPSHDPRLANIVDFDCDLTRGRALWLSWNERLYASRLTKNESADESQTSDELLLWYDYYDYLQFSGRRIAWDHLNDKLYTVDTFLNPSVEVLDAAGKHRSVLLSFEPTGRTRDYVFAGPMPAELEEVDYAGMLLVQELPAEIELDPEAGLMFVRTNVSSASRIHRVNMDGTSLKLLINDTGKIRDDSCRIDIDRVNKRIYWNDCDTGSIESADYEGQNRVTVVKADSPIALAVYDQYLVWSQNTADVSARGRIRFCKLTDNVCKPDDIRVLPLPGIDQVPYKLKLAPSPLPSTSPKVSNPCSTDNGGCQHLCLLKASNSSSSPNKTTPLAHGCACKIGYRLSANSRDCEPILSYLVYESNNYLRGRTLEPAEDSSGNVTTKPYSFFPSQIVEGVVARDQLVAIDYNPMAGKLLVMDCRVLRQIDLDGNLVGCWRVARNQSDCYKDLAYDWQAGKVYTTKMKGANGDYTLGVVDVPSSFKRRAIVKPEILRTIDRPLSLIVHPKSGYLYLLTISNATNATVVSRANVGGHNATALTIDVGPMDAPRGLALDTHQDRLYWFAESGRIAHSDLDGRDAKVLGTMAPVIKPNSMVVDEEWIYVKNETSVWRMDKETGERASCIVAEAEHTKLKSTMRIIQRSPDRLYYGDDYQITKAACKVFCAYQEDTENDNKSPDAEFCKCPKKNSDSR